MMELDQVVRMRSPTLRQADFSGRAKIREAALTLFGTEGFSVTVRAIANAAGVSPGLVIHHFGTKQRLREAVDESVLATVLERFDSIPVSLSADELSRSMGDAFADAIGTSPAFRQYLRRCLLDETAASMAILDQLVALTERSLDQLDGAGGLRSDSDAQWRPFQVLFVILGALLLEPVIQRHLDQPVFAPEVIRRRTNANYDFLANGLFRAVPTDETREGSS